MRSAIWENAASPRSTAFWSASISAASLIARSCEISGLGWRGYIAALDGLVGILKEKQP